MELQGRRVSQARLRIHFLEAEAWVDKTLFSLLNNQQNRDLSTPASAPNKCILNLSKHVLTDSEEAVLMKGLIFPVTYPHFNLDMACAVESVVSKLSRTLGIEFRYRIGSTLEKS
jgi:hypothetical protein